MRSHSHPFLDIVFTTVSQFDLQWSQQNSIWITISATFTQTMRLLREWRLPSLRKCVYGDVTVWPLVTWNVLSPLPKTIGIICCIYICFYKPIMKSVKVTLHELLCSNVTHTHIQMTSPPTDFVCFKRGIKNKDTQGLRVDIIAVVIWRH